MDNLERWFWLKYQEQIPMEYEIYRNRIDQILEDGKSEKFKIMTLNDNLRILGIGWKVMATRWFNELSQGIKKEVFDLIWNFSDFNLDNPCVSTWPHTLVVWDNVYFRVMIMRSNQCQNLQTVHLKSK